VRYSITTLPPTAWQQQQQRQQQQHSQHASDNVVTPALCMFNGSSCAMMQGKKTAAFIMHGG
jgi:hypothetical protein